MPAAKLAAKFQEAEIRARVQAGSVAACGVWAEHCGDSPQSGVVEQTLSNWVKPHRGGTLKEANGKSGVTPEQLEINCLRAELARVTMERDILGKAAASLKHINSMNAEHYGAYGWPRIWCQLRKSSIRVRQATGVKDVKVWQFNNLEDPGGSLSPCKHIRGPEPTYRKAYRVFHFLQVGHCSLSPSIDSFAPRVLLENLALPHLKQAKRGNSVGIPGRRGTESSSP